MREARMYSIYQTDFAMWQIVLAIYMARLWYCRILWSVFIIHVPSNKLRGRVYFNQFVFSVNLLMKFFTVLYSVNMEQNYPDCNLDVFSKH